MVLAFSKLPTLFTYNINDRFLLKSHIYNLLKVIIETKLVDELGQSWNLGVKTHLNIKSFEDGRHQNTRGSVTR